MFVETLHAENFRNYSNLEIELTKKINIFIGDNGEGKTNILEGIYLFSHLKSFRDSSDDEMVQWGKNYYYLKIDVRGNSSKTLEIGYTNEKEKKKKLKINNLELNKKTEFIGEIKNITFLPNDLKILESPHERRRFIDGFLGSINSNYLEVLLEYNKILRHRNKLLKEKNFSLEEMNVWDKMLSEKGVYIQNVRENFFSKFQFLFKENIKRISHSKDEIVIKYLPNLKNPSLFYEELRSKREIDSRMGYTTLGIHRDDFFLGQEEKELNSFGSQGQKRSVVLALKFSLFNYTQEFLSETPILLVDDIIRELDVQRRNDFLNFLDSAGQVLFTTTDLEGLHEYISNKRENIQVFKVKNAKVENVF